MGRNFIRMNKSPNWKIFNSVIVHRNGMSFLVLFT